MSDHYGGGPDDDFDRGYRAGLQNGGKERDLLRAELASERERADKERMYRHAVEQAERITIKAFKREQANVAKLREALKEIIADCEADYPPSHGAIKYRARAVLAETKGEENDTQ